MASWPSHNATPPSLVYPPDGTATWFPRLGLPGVTQSFGINGKRVAIIELRGGLRQVGDACNDGDPDWHCTIEPDLDWLDQMGLATEQGCGPVIRSTASGRPRRCRPRSATVPRVAPSTRHR